MELQEAESVIAKKRQEEEARRVVAAERRRQEAERLAKQKAERDADAKRRDEEEAAELREVLAFVTRHQRTFTRHGGAGCIEALQEAFRRVERRLQGKDEDTEADRIEATILKLEQLRITVARELDVEQRERQRDVYRIQHLRKTLTQIEEGANPADPMDPRLYTVLSRPDVQGFYIASPGIEPLKRKLAALREAS